MQPGEELENLVAELEDIVSQAKSTFGGGGQKKIVDSEEIYQIIDDIKDTFPEEFATARRILKEQDEILADAQQQAMILAGDQEVVRLAQQKADDIRDAAQQYERDTRYNAEEYVEEILEHLEDNLKSIVVQVTRCRQTLTDKAGSRSGQQNW